MSFRERGQPLLGPYGIADNRRSLDGRQHQAEVDPAVLQRTNLCDGWHLQEIKMNLGPLLTVCGDNARQHAGHHVFGRRQSQPPTLAVGHRQHRHLGVFEVVEHLAHIAEKRAADFRQPRAVARLAEEKVSA
jgi:hypothetical protein